MSEQLATTAEVFKFSPEILETLPVFDKSWMIRLGALQAFAGSTRMAEFLESQDDEIGEDLEALARVSRQWINHEPLEVGESGTIFRIFQFAAWVEQAEKPNAPIREFIKSGSLIGRDITNNPDIINWGIEELLELDEETTQWATAAILQGQFKRPSGWIEPKLQDSFDARTHWIASRFLGKPWQPRSDMTIERQASSYINALASAEVDFIPLHAEDYCFARAYGKMNKEEALLRWPRLTHHESNRIESMEVAIEQAVNGKIIDVNDHRVVQAIAMRFGLGRDRFKYPDCVAKSWPRFWDFVAVARNQNGVYHWQPA